MLRSWSSTRSDKIKKSNVLSAVEGQIIENLLLNTQGVIMEKRYPKVGFGILVLSNNKVLLGKRNDDAQKASSELHGEGTWTMPGGKLHFQEAPQNGATRELLEETNLIAKAKDLKLVSITNDMTGDAHFITFGFLCEKYSGELKTMEPEEITEWDWFDINNLPSNLYNPSKKLLDNYLKNSIYSVE
jgi:ADP-ribose pyrophosphatase YjhB (NUDIX family)